MPPFKPTQKPTPQHQSSDTKVVIAPATTVLNEGDEISMDATKGNVYAGSIPTVTADLRSFATLSKLLEWADAMTEMNGGLEVHANADSGVEALRARSFGAKGIGLVRTEHTFFAKAVLPIVVELIQNLDNPSKM